MDFIYCTKCGTRYSAQLERCPACGNMRFQNPEGNGFNCSSDAHGYHNPQFYGYNPYCRKKRTFNTTQLVLSIINIVCGFGFIFGVLSLVFTILARDAATDDDEKSKLQIAKILNIIGIVISVIFLLILLLYIFILILILGAGIQMFSALMFF